MENGTIYVLAVLAAVAFASFAAYDSERARASRGALGIILLAALAVPFIDTVCAIPDIIDENLPEYDTDAGSMAQDVAREAFLRGIRLAVADKFSLNADDIAVTCCGFSFEEMRAESLVITLSGKAAFADIRAVREFAEKSGFGECEVYVSFE